MLGWMQTSDPAGAIVLERCRVLRDTSAQRKHGFTIGKVFASNDHVTRSKHVSA